MIKGMINDALLKAKLNTGFSAAFVVWGVVATISVAAAFVFLCIAAFVWLSASYGAALAGVVMAVFFLAVSLIAMTLGLAARRRAVERARAELILAAAARGQSASWLDPKLLAVGVQLAQTIGLKRILPLAAAAFLATELGREWAARSRDRADKPKS